MCALVHTGRVQELTNAKHCSPTTGMWRPAELPGSMSVCMPGKRERERFVHIHERNVLISVVFCSYERDFKSATCKHVNQKRLCRTRRRQMQSARSRWRRPRPTRPLTRGRGWRARTPRSCRRRPPSLRPHSRRHRCAAPLASAPQVHCPFSECPAGALPSCKCPAGGPLPLHLLRMQASQVPYGLFLRDAQVLPSIRAASVGMSL